MDKKEITIPEYEARDMILKYCLKQKGRHCGAYELAKTIFNNDNNEVIRTILVNIEYEKPHIANIVVVQNAQAHITSNKLTQSFLDQGGFTSIAKKEKETENRMRRKEEAEFENLESSTRLNKWLIKMKWLPHILATISIIISIIALAFSLRG